MKKFGTLLTTFLSCWEGGGTIPPYYGAFGEGFDLGAGEAQCGAYFFTQIGGYIGQRADAYISEGGVSGPPEAVLFMLSDIAFWPSISHHDVEMGWAVCGEFTLGYWADFSWRNCPWFIAFDQNGPGGHRVLEVR